MSLDDVAGVGIQRDLGLVARLDLMQLVLAEHREDLGTSSTKVITSLNGMATKNPGRSITFTIVLLPGATTVVCDSSQRAVSSCARGIDLRL